MLSNNMTSLSSNRNAYLTMHLITILSVLTSDWLTVSVALVSGGRAPF